MATEAARSRDPIAGEDEPGTSGTGCGDDAANNAKYWRFLLAIGFLPAALYVVLPYGTVASAVYVFSTLIAAVAVAVAVLNRRHLFSPASWILISSALVLATVGHAIWYWLDLNGMEPFPSSADAFYLAVYPLFGLALSMLGRQSGHDEDALSDALIVGTSAGVLGWAVLVAPYINDPTLTFAQLFVSTAYPVADLFLLPLILRLVFLHRTRIGAHFILLVGMLAYLAADMLYAHGNLTGWYMPGGVTDGLWLVAYALFAAAAWHPSASVTPQAHTSKAELSRRRLLVLGASSIVVPTVILLTAGTDVTVVRGAAVASIVLFVLVMHRMARLLQQTHRQAEELEELSKTDPLTGAANRRHLNDRLAYEIARAERTHRPMSLAFVDLDHFKRFNDTHGHSTGDLLLQQLVATWRNELRPVDVLARYGGEEFVIILPETDTVQGLEVMERLRHRVPFGQTCSAGLAMFHPADTSDALIRRADTALYRAKNTGRNRTVISNECESSAAPTGCY